MDRLKFIFVVFNIVLVLWLSIDWFLPNDSLNIALSMVFVILGIFFYTFLFFERRNKKDTEGIFPHYSSLLVIILSFLMIIIFIPSQRAMSFTLLLVTTPIFILIFFDFFDFSELGSNISKCKKVFLLRKKIKNLSEEECKILLFLKKNEPYSLLKSDIKEQLDKKRMYDIFRKLENLELVNTSVNLDSNANSWEFYLSYMVKEALLKSLDGKSKFFG